MIAQFLLLSTIFILTYLMFRMMNLFLIKQLLNLTYQYLFDSAKMSSNGKFMIITYYYQRIKYQLIQPYDFEMMVKIPNPRIIIDFKDSIQEYNFQPGVLYTFDSNMIGANRITLINPLNEYECEFRNRPPLDASEIHYEE